MKEPKRKPGEKSLTNDLIVQMRKKGKPIKAIASEFGESEWYVKRVLALHMTEQSRWVAARLCREIGAAEGKKTQKRRRALRQMIGDMEFHDHSSDEDLVKFPVPSRMTFAINRNKLHQALKKANRDGIKLSTIVFPLLEASLKEASLKINEALGTLE